MIFLFPVLFVSWKFIHKTKWRAPEEVDLFSDKADIDEYERQFVPAPPRYAAIRPPSLVLSSEPDLSLY